MEIKSYRQKFPNGEGYLITETGWKSAVYGITNSKDSGDLDPEDLEEIEESARELEYSGELGVLGKLASRFYGGTVTTEYGTAEWIGQAPEEVQEFVDSIRQAIEE
jgi:hypothetical protein